MLSSIQANLIAWSASLEVIFIKNVLLSLKVLVIEILLWVFPPFNPKPLQWKIDRMHTKLNSVVQISVKFISSTEVMWVMRILDLLDFHILKSINDEKRRLELHRCTNFLPNNFQTSLQINFFNIRMKIGKNSYTTFTWLKIFWKFHVFKAIAIRSGLELHTKTEVGLLVKLHSTNF